MSRADAKHSVHLLHDYPAKAHAWSVTAEDKSVLLGAAVSYQIVCFCWGGACQDKFNSNCDCALCRNIQRMTTGTRFRRWFALLRPLLISAVPAGGARCRGWCLVRCSYSAMSWHARFECSAVRFWRYWYKSGHLEASISPKGGSIRILPNRLSRLRFF